MFLWPEMEMECFNFVTLESNKVDTFSLKLVILIALKFLLAVDLVNCSDDDKILHLTAVFYVSRLDIKQKIILF